jgi:hypothetical protein
MRGTVYGRSGSAVGRAFHFLKNIKRLSCIIGCVDFDPRQTPRGRHDDPDLGSDAVDRVLIPVVYVPFINHCSDGVEIRPKRIAAHPEHPDVFPGGNCRIKFLSNAREVSVSVTRFHFLLVEFFGGVDDE